MGDVIFRLVIAAEGLIMFHVLDDTHDLAPDRLVSDRDPRLDVFADRILVREMSFGEGLIDNYDAGRFCVVKVGESASGNQWNFHYAEVIRGDRAEMRTRPSALRDVAPLNFK